MGKPELDLRQRALHAQEGLLDELARGAEVHAHVGGAVLAVVRARVQLDLRVPHEEQLDHLLGREVRRSRGFGPVGLRGQPLRVDPILHCRHVEPI